MEKDMWECACGQIEYVESPPEECNKCWEINSFTKVPENRIEEMKDHILEHIRVKSDDGEEDES